MVSNLPVVRPQGAVRVRPTWDLLRQKQPTVEGNLWSFPLAASGSGFLRGLSTP
jgi:hypothetical protein